MKWIGTVCIVISAWSVGYEINRKMKYRCLQLQQMLRALQLLRNEIAFCGTSLPNIFALMAATCDGALEALFSFVAKEMDHSPWKTPIEAAKPLLENSTQDTLPILEDLFRGLGNYDMDAQLATIERVQTAVRNSLDAAEQDRRKRSKTYETIGICAGLSVAILLL